MGHPIGPNSKIGKLTVVAQLDSYKFSSPKTGKMSSRKQWECVCDCGNKVVKSTSQLNQGNVKAKHLSCSDCSYQTRPQSQNRQSQFERMFSIRVEGSAAKRNIPVTMSLDDYMYTASQRCHYCGDFPKWTSYQKNKFAVQESIYVNGIDRVDSTKGYEPGNIVPCCKVCNVMKFTLTQEEFFDHIHRVWNYCKATGVLSTDKTAIFEAVADEQAMNPEELDIALTTMEKNYNIHK